MADIGKEVERITIEPQKIPREKPAPQPAPAKTEFFVEVGGKWMKLGEIPGSIVMNWVRRDR